MHLVLLALLASAPAEAKSLKKLSDAELADVLAGSDPKAAEDAADLLGERHTASATEALGAGCPAGGNANVCEATLAALEDQGTDTARVHVEAALRNRDVADSARHKALKILKKQDRARLAAALPDVLAEYRSLDEGFAVAAIEMVPELGLKEFQDITVLIAQDGVPKRRVRLAGLAAAEKLQHPALWTAYLELITDSDTKIRVNAAKGLGRSGVPGNVAVPALTKAARQDADGNVRAAAMSALRFYAHPGLLPTLHDAALNEKNMFAWGHAMELLLVLADNTSVPTLIQILEQGGDTLLPESLVRVIHTIVRVGDPAAVPALEALARRTQDDTVRREADAAIRLLKGPEPERVRIVETFTVVEVHHYDPVAPPPPMPTLSVQVGADGFAVWANVQ